MMAHDDVSKILILSEGAFDPAHYLAQAIAAGASDLWKYRSLIDHYLASGWRDGLSPSRDFDIRSYLAANPDIREADIEPLSHFLATGRNESRLMHKPCSGFPLGIAFYLPQFYPDPKNEQWWGKGFTDWTNVTRARPLFEGHVQPILPGELGFYDLRLCETLNAQATLAKEFGLYGFCLYHYWFNGCRVLDAPLRNILSHPQLEFPFCLCWANENWTRRWDGMDDEILLSQEHTPESDYRFIYDVLPAMLDQRYLKKDGRPILLVYRADLLSEPANTTALWREVALQEGLPGLFLVAVQFRINDPRPYGFDALVEFPPHHFPADPFTPQERSVLGTPPTLTLRSYARGVARSVASQREAGFPILPAVMPGWDNTARRMENATVFAGATPSLFRLWTTAQMLRVAGQPRPDDELIFINAWNEWAEGAVLEPRRDLGRAFLTAFRAAKDAIQDFFSTGEADAYIQLIHWLQRIDESAQSGRKALVVVSHDAQRAGAQMLLLRLLSGVRQRDSTVDLFLVLLADGPLSEEFAAVGPTLTCSCFAAAGTPHDQAIELIVAGLAPRVSLPLLCNTGVTAAFSAAAAKHGLKTILYVHEMPTSIEMYVGNDAFLAGALESQRIIAVSEFARRALCDDFPELQSRIEVIRASVPDDDARISASDDRELLTQMNIDATRPIVLGCGAVHPRKGADLYPALAQAVLRERPDAQFIWCGGVQSDPEYLRWIEYDVRARGLTGKVRFLGMLEDVGPLYRAARALVILSREDPFPLVALEAARMGLPVLVFEDAGGAVELLDGLDELRAPYGDINRMAARLGAILRDANLQSYLGASLQNRLSSGGKWDAYVNRMLDQLLGASRKSTSSVLPQAVAARNTAGDLDVPRVSVVIPFYNHGRFIHETLDSVARQTCPAHEIIIIDDGSRETDRAAAEAAAAKVANARFRSRPNRGAHATINEACSEANGEFISILNSDDIYHPRRLEQLVTAAKLRPSVGLFATGATMIADDGKKFDQGAWYHEGWARIDRGDPLWLALLRANVLLTTSNFFFRRSFFQKVGAFRPFRYVHDLDMLERSLFAGEVELIRSELLSYRFHSENTIRENLHASRVETAQVIAEAWYNWVISEGYDAAMAGSVARAVHEEGLQDAFVVFIDSLDKERAVSACQYAQIRDTSAADRAAAALTEFDRQVGRAERSLRINSSGAGRSIIEQGGWLPDAIMALSKYRKLERPAENSDQQTSAALL